MKGGWFVIHGNGESLANLDSLWKRVQILLMTYEK